MEPWKHSGQRLTPHNGRTLVRARWKLFAGLIAWIYLIGFCNRGLLFAGPLPTAPSTHSTAQSIAPHAAPPHLPFYVATKGHTTIYVLGTLHSGDPADYPPEQPFRSPILEALAASQLAFELSPDDLTASQDEVTRYGLCRAPCLPKLLPAALWRQLAYRLRRNPVALEEIKKFRPWLAALLIESFDVLLAGLRTEYSTETQLENLYVDKPIIGLETLNQQVHAFTGLTLAQQWEMLAQDLAQTPEQNAADIRALHQLWRTGDADQIAHWNNMKTRQLTQTPDLARAINEKTIYRRNRCFVARMIALAAPRQPLFVAIGALHLGGPRGVLARLRQRGFVVKPG